MVTNRKGTSQAGRFCLPANVPFWGEDGIFSISVCERPRGMRIVSNHNVAFPLRESNSGRLVLRFFGMVRDDMRPFFFKDSLFSFGEIFSLRGWVNFRGVSPYTPSRRPRRI